MPPAAKDLYDDPADSLQVVVVDIQIQSITMLKMKIAISTLMPTLLEQGPLEAKEMYSTGLDFYFE